MNKRRDLEISGSEEADPRTEEDGVEERKHEETS